MIFVSIAAMAISLLTLILHVYKELLDRPQLSLDVFCHCCITDPSKSKYTIRLCNYGRRPETLVGYELIVDGKEKRNHNFNTEKIKTLRESEVSEISQHVFYINELNSFCLLAASGKRWRLNRKQILKINRLISKNHENAKKRNFKPRVSTIDLSNTKVEITQIE